MSEINHSKTRRYQLCVDRIETLEDVKKILDVMRIQIQTDNSSWKDVEKYFCLEIIPKGYFKLLEKIGWEEMSKLNYDQMEKQAFELLNETESNEE